VTDDDSINEFAPEFSPDGTHIAVEAGSATSNADGIYVVDLVSGNVVQLTSVTGLAFNMYPTYSPDGATIAFSRKAMTPKGGVGRIYLMGSDGSNLHPITDEPQNTDVMTWSVDGTRLVFQAYDGPFNGFDTPPGAVPIRGESRRFRPAQVEQLRRERESRLAAAPRQELGRAHRARTPDRRSFRPEPPAAEPD